MPLVKLPTTLAERSAGLQAGDIILFTMNPHRSSKAATASDEFVKLFQSFVNGSNGHKNIYHAGFVVEVDGKLMMAHLELDKFKFTELSEYPEKRTTVVYRIRDEAKRHAMAGQLNAIMREKKDGILKKVRFRWWMIVEDWIRRMGNALGFLNTKIEPSKAPTTKEHPIQKNSICTDVIIDCFTEAARRLDVGQPTSQTRDDYMNITPHAMLKTLQSYLHNNINYDCYIFPHKNNQYDKLDDVVHHEIERLSKSKNKRAQRKAEKLNAAVSAYATEVNQEPKMTDPYRQALCLVKHIMPALRMNTGLGFAVPHSYKAVIRMAKSQGIYPEYCEPTTTEESSAAIEQGFRESNYTDKEKHVYNLYRKRGFSQEEAVYQARPNKTTWREANPRLTYLSTYGLFGLMAVSLYRQAKIANTVKRNKALSIV